MAAKTEELDDKGRVDIRGTGYSYMDDADPMNAPDVKLPASWPNANGSATSTRC